MTITVINQLVTGQTRGFCSMVSDSNVFPVHVREDVVALGCLDAPERTLTGGARFYIKTAGTNIVFANTVARDE